MIARLLPLAWRMLRAQPWTLLGRVGLVAVVFAALYGGFSLAQETARLRDAMVEVPRLRVLPRHLREYSVAPLPDGYAPRVATLPGVVGTMAVLETSVALSEGLSGRRTLTLRGVSAGAIADVAPVSLDAGTLALWRQGQDAAPDESGDLPPQAGVLAGRRLAALLEWQIGRDIVLPVGAGLPVRLVGVYDDAFGEAVLYLHLSYLQEQLGVPDRCSYISVRVDAQEALAPVATAIDDMLVSLQSPTRTLPDADVTTARLERLRTLGWLGRLVPWVVAITSVLMAMFRAMAHAVARPIEALRWRRVGATWAEWWGLHAMAGVCVASLGSLAGAVVVAVAVTLVPSIYTDDITLALVRTPQPWVMAFLLTFTVALLGTGLGQGLAMSFLRHDPNQENTLPGAVVNQHILHGR